MTFLAASYLWVLPAALLPVIIYLIFRRRRRDVPWGSMYILRRVLETRSRVRAWLQYLILALRTLAIAALVAAFAQPVGSRSQPPADVFPPPPPSTHRIVLLDTSASMAGRYESSTRLESALSLCRKFMNSGCVPAQLDILPLDGRTAPIRCASLPLSPSASEELLAACSTPSGAADLARALRTATGLFRASPMEHKELYVLSDFTRTKVSDPLETAELLALLTASGVRVRCLTYTPPRTCNFAVLDLTANSDVLLANQPSLFYVRVGCYSTLPSADTVLTLEADAGTPMSKVLREEPLSMALGEKTLVFPLGLPAGRHTITASVRPDDLPSDNRATRSYTVRPALRVAIVQDLLDAKGFENPRTWLQMALENPKSADSSAAKINSTAEAVAAATRQSVNADFKAADEAGKPCEILLEGKIPEQLNPDLLRELDLVIISGVTRLESSVLKALQDFIRHGGTLILAPAPGNDIAAFRATYASLAPAAIDAPRYRDVEVERYEHCVAESTEYPLLRELESAEHGNLSNPRFYNWFTLKAQTPASLHAGTEAGTTLLALTDGAPLLLERRIGRGTVLLWTAGLGQDWHSMVVHPVYLVFLVRFAGLAAGRRQFPSNLAVGTPILMPSEALAVRVVRPDGRSATVSTTALRDRRFLRYDETDVAGVYDVREDTESATPGVLFTVAADTKESDLRPLTPGIQAQVEAAAQSPFLHSEAELVRNAVETYPGRSWLLTAALLMAVSFLLEAGLSRRFFA
ncbi:MAG TPA: BatA domain-containing protein [Planctomycetota bacterium]|jgi:hypothetical protein